jgi:O-methyltransferase
VDRSFLDLHGKIRDYSLLDELRLYELWQLADQVGHLHGDVIEVGCWRGGAGCMIAKRIAQRQDDATVFLCDTFAGVVKASERDSAYRGGEHADSDVAIVEDLARSVGATNVQVLKGMFPEATGSQVDKRQFKFVHIDVDVYQGAKDAFEWLVPRLLIGSIVVFDDYGSSQTSGIRSFIDELHGSEDFAIVRNINGQATAVRRTLSAASPRP